MTDEIKRKHPQAVCEKCPLQDAPFVPTSGPSNAKVAFVSRSPGKHDVRTKRPFGGPSGKVLDHLLNKYKVRREDIITTNVVLCQSDDPPKDAVRCCKPRLEEEIKDVDLVVAGGAEAVDVLTRYRTVFNARGFEIKRKSIDGRVQRAIATNNPAAVMRDSDKYPDMVADFRRAFDPLPPPVFPKVEIIDEPRNARSVLRKWMGTEFNTPIASDLEWAGKEIECAGFSRDGKKAIVFSKSAIGDSSVKQLLSAFYTRPDVRFLWHNGKADTKILIANGIDGRVDEDTFLMSYALDERPGYHKLEYLLSSELGWPDYEPASVKHFKSHGEYDPSIPLRKAQFALHKYNGFDTAGTLRLYQILLPRLESENLLGLYERLLYVDKRLRTVELNGFGFDVTEACNINEREVIPRLWELKAKLREISNHTLLNPRSTQQMAAIYYDEWGLEHNLRDKPNKKFKRSTGKEVREEIFGDRYRCNVGEREKILEFATTHARFRKVSDVQSKYIEGLALKCQKDGKLYGHFNIGGTATGRTSGSEPNLQNITREGVDGIPGIRTLFRPTGDDAVIISADYSQAELRTCAKLSGDANLLGIYRDSSRSLHRERAERFYGKNYTKEQYVQSKNINFGVTYGQSAFAFAQMYHMPEKEAQAYIDSWWREFPKLLYWTQQTSLKIKEGYVQSPFGHKRRFHLITEENIGDLQREAVNFLPQNIAAWLTIMSLCDLVDSGIRVIATVHDSIVAECRRNEIDGTARYMKKVMEEQPIKQLSWNPDDIPFLVDVSVGPNWGDVKEITIDPNLEVVAA